jgi:hypothetical protein
VQRRRKAAAIQWVSELTDELMAKIAAMNTAGQWTLPVKGSVCALK